MGEADPTPADPAHVVPPGADSELSLCAQFQEALFASGASITVFGHKRSQSTLCATDLIAARGDAIQFELGEGPHWQALKTGKSVLCPDLTSPVAEQWPVFAAAAREIGMAAVFAIPMTIGAVVVGTVDLYSTTVRHLDAHQISIAESMAGRAASTAVHLAMASANDANAKEGGTVPAMRREVHQATGMIQAQLDCTATEAFARLRAHAFASGRAMIDVAFDVVGRRIDFSQIPE